MHIFNLFMRYYLTHKSTRRGKIIARIIDIRDGQRVNFAIGSPLGSQKRVEMNPRDVLRQMMFMHETVAANFADELWLLPALDALVLAERLFPLVRLAASVAHVSFVVHRRVRILLAHMAYLELVLRDPQS